MLYGVKDLNSGEKVRATPKARAYCPYCESPLIAKCGSLTIWHWAHKNLSECDSWSEGEGEWHLWWKSLFPPDLCEVTIERNGKRHRADILTPNGVVIELQNSSISAETIAEREKFYDKIIWLFNAHDYHILISNVAKQPGHARYRWWYKRKSVMSASKPVILDLVGRTQSPSKRLLFTTDWGGCSGAGNFVSVQHFQDFVTTKDEDYNE